MNLSISATKSGWFIFEPYGPTMPAIRYFFSKHGADLVNSGRRGRKDHPCHYQQCHWHIYGMTRTLLLHERYEISLNTHSKFY